MTASPVNNLKQWLQLVPVGDGIILDMALGLALGSMLWGRGGMVDATDLEN
jgi:hypothetical protein